MSTKGLASSLFPLTRRLVLRELVLDEKKGIHLRELARRTSLDLKGVQREVRNLSEYGIILEENVGNQKQYRLNEKSPIYSELKMLIIKTVALADELNKALQPLKGKIDIAFIYGSFAAGTEDSESDIDLMVVGDVSLKEIIGAVYEVGQKLSRQISPTVLSLNEYQKGMQERSGFIFKVSSEMKISLIGDLDDS